MKQSIDELAQKIRAECLAGYTWNVPKEWRDVHPVAKENWRKKALERLGEVEHASVV